MITLTEKATPSQWMYEQAPNAFSVNQKKQGVHIQTYRQFIRFVFVGCSNTVIDVFVLNALLWLWPTRSAALLVLLNSITYATGAINSFILNRYWTFQRVGRPVSYEARRFVLVTLGGILCNDILFGLLTGVVHPGALNSTLWTSIVKVISIGGTVLVSYLAMRLWVFASYPQRKLAMASTSLRDTYAAPPITPPPSRQPLDISTPLSTTPGLSVVLPAYNEEQVIATTLHHVLDTLHDLVADFEVLVVNDGSTDRTGDIVAAICQGDPRVRLLTHEHNQGYGATLVDGFAAATRACTFFMDADGQFDIRELAFLLGSIDKYDAVIGYRLKRQDAWMRKFNARGWKMVIRLALGVQVRDLDCAFKLVRTAVLRHICLETRGAMINAELLYKMKREGYSYTEVGVHHFPRQGGKATGAKLRVIFRAFRECFFYARKWQCEFESTED